MSDLPTLTSPSFPDLHLLPVVHDRLEIAFVARRVLDELDPLAIAVELPETLFDAVERAVRRLPKISLVISQEEDEEALVWAVAPGDPIVEAVRWASERDRRWLAIDPDVPYAERHPEATPDPYALWTLADDDFLGAIAGSIGGSIGGEVSEADRQRERGMAHRLREVLEQSDGGTVVAVVGAAHVRRVVADLEGPTAVPFARRRRAHVELRHLDADSLTALLPDPPLAHAVWERVRGGEPPEPVPLEETVAPRISLQRAGLTLLSREPTDLDRRERLVDYAANEATRSFRDGLLAPDRRLLADAVWRRAVSSHTEQTHEEIAPWQRRVFRDFARRHARVQGLLVPGLYEWTTAARGVADDNFAWEVFDAARTYPWQEEAEDLPSVSVDGDELDLGTRTIRFRRRFFRVKQRPRRLAVRERPTTDDPAEWLEGFRTLGGICSYPPEDVVVEDYGRYLRQKAESILSAERQRSEPFSASLLDGIDIRETLRHLHEGRVWVEERRRAPGKAGSVIVIFDRDRDDAEYPYLMTWLGEHDQESDMAFYSTPPGEQVVGPGIMRATYGGFLMTVPPGRLFDVWRDPDYAHAREKAEVLVMAGIDYSEDRHVVHVAADPPSNRLHRYAERRGRRLAHVPIGSLSPTTLRKIRVVHILAGHDKRQIAGDYVW